jgi:hypothetical protein
MGNPLSRCARQRTAGFAHSRESRRVGTQGRRIDLTVYVPSALTSYHYWLQLPGREPIAGTYTDVRTRERLDQDGAQNITAKGRYALFGQLTALNRGF